MSEFWKAVDDNTQAIQADPKMYEAYFDRATCYDLLQMESEAKDDMLRYETLKREKSWQLRQQFVESSNRS